MGEERIDYAHAAEIEQLPLVLHEYEVQLTDIPRMISIEVDEDITFDKGIKEEGVGGAS